MTGTVLLALAALLAAALLVQAVARCRREIREERARVRRRADIADVFGKARARWDRQTSALEEALGPWLALPDAAATQVTVAATGFGDSIVAEERLRQAFRQMDLVEEN